MLRLIFVILIVLLVLAVARRLVSAVRRPRDNSPARLVQCEQCGVYITEVDAITDGTHHYCCTRHRDQSSSN